MEIKKKKKEEVFLLIVYKQNKIGNYQVKKCKQKCLVHWDSKINVTIFTVVYEVKKYVSPAILL